MYWIRVICNKYDDYQYQQQVHYELYEWLFISRRLTLYKDLRLLIGKSYIQRKRSTDCDSYKTIVFSILFACLVCYCCAQVCLKLSERKTQRNILRAVFTCIESFVAIFTQHTMVITTGQNDLKQCEFILSCWAEWIVKFLSFPVDLLLGDFQPRP